MMPALDSTERSRIPTTGMRGGLGRTLLTAFLVLAIVPLSAVTWYATRRERQDIQREVTAKLSSVATMMETQAEQWIEQKATHLSRLIQWSSIPENVRALQEGDDEDGRARSELEAQLRAIVEKDPSCLRGGIVDTAGRALVSTDAAWTAQEVEFPSSLEPEQSYTVRSDESGRSFVQVVRSLAGPGGNPLAWFVVHFDLTPLTAAMREANPLSETGDVYLVDAEGVAWPQERTLTSPGIETAFSEGEAEGLFDNHEGVPVIGVYRLVPEWGLVLVAEQLQADAFAPTESITAAIVGATLVVALVTAVIAAVVTRQITHPLVRLTESALQIANGDLEQQVPVDSRDEIGILAYVFNHMAAELKELYEDLESKVAERTALLQRANYQIQRRAIQMEASLEVGQAVTSILDPDRLLDRVVQVVKDRFIYSYVGVYTVDGEDEPLWLRAWSGDADPAHGAEVRPDRDGPVSRAFREGEAVVESHPIVADSDTLLSYRRSEVCLPLRLGDRAKGVLDVQTTDEEGFNEDDVSVLQNVANQIAIALENARAYALEREAAERLRELDRAKRRFLTNMSHELRTPLNNVIGFSRLMLKGVEGKLTERQRRDVEIIYQNSQHLMGLINDILDISQLEAGLMELQFQRVDLRELIHSVMATASALVRDKDIDLRHEIAPDLPSIQADPMRVRQVLLQLLANAAKFTEEGFIEVRAWSNPEQVWVSVEDSGMGIPERDQERIFEQFEQGSQIPLGQANGAGVGLTLSKEFVERHGGEIWVDSDVGAGATFTFTLPRERDENFRQLHVDGS